MELEKDENGNPQTWTQFIKAKVLVRSENPCLSTSDEVVKVMLHLFPSLECRVIPHPYCNNPAKTPDKVSPDFNAAIEQVTKALLSDVNLKPGLSANFDGSMLANLAREYVKALNSDENITIEGSLYTTIFQKLEDLTEELVKKYWEKMEKILEPKYPLEEGTMDDEEHPPTTLMAFHQQVFKECKLTLTKKADMYMPAPNTASPDASTSTIDKKKVDILTKFQKRIYEFEAIPSQGMVLVRGELHQFVTKNKAKSSEQCMSLFDDLVQQDDVRLTQLKQDYMAKAVGPAKEEVFEKKAQWISGPPEYVKVSGSTHNHVEIMWKKPTIHVDAAQNYEVQSKEEGKKWISSELTQELYKVFDDLRPNVNYRLRVRGVNNHNRGEWSKELVFTTPPGTPNKPKRPDIRLKSSTTATLHIQQLEPGDDNGSAVTHVRVESKLQDSSPKVTLSSLEPHQNIRDMIVTKDVSLDQSATCDGFYYFRVILKNDVGESKPSEYTKVATRELIPGPPQNLIYKKCETNQIVLQWHKPNFHPFAVKKYEVERENTTGTWDKTVETQSNVLTATVGNLEPNTKYKFRICAVNENKEGESSEEFEAQTKPDVPGKPPKPEVTITAPQKAAITVQLLEKKDENGRPVTHVKIEKSAVASSVDADWSSEQFEVDSGVRLIKQDINLENRVQFFRVRMKNEVGDSEPSEIVQAPYLIPGPPQNICKQENLWVQKTSHNRISISWDKPAAQPQAVKRFEVEIQGKGVSQPICETTENFITFSDLEPNTVYKFCVRSTNEEKKGEWSEILEVKSAPGPPNRPNKPDIQVLSDHKATITVPKFHKRDENGSPVTNLIVQVCTEADPNAEWSDYEEFPMECDKSIKKDIPLKDDSFYFRVLTKNEVGRSEPSDPFEVPAFNLVPGKPWDLYCAAASHDKIKLTWKKPQHFPRAAKRYEVEIKKVGDEWKHVAIQKVTKVDISDLKANTKYHFRIVAANENRRGEYSDEFVARTTPGPPSNPQKPQLYISSVTRVKLTVQRLTTEEENGSPVTHVIVESSKDCIDWNPAGEFRLTEENVIDVKLSKGVRCFRVKMRNDKGESCPSPVVDVPPELFPGKPKNVKCIKVLHDQVTLSWQQPEVNPEAATRYELEMRPTNINEWKLVKIIDYKAGRPLKAVAERLEHNTKHHFRVCAINGPHHKRGEYQGVSATTFDTPGHPQKVHVIDRRYTYLKIGWRAPKTHPEYVEHYVVHICRDHDRLNAGWQHLNKLFPANCSSVVISGLNEDTYYHVCIRALNRNGNGGSGYIRIGTRSRNHTVLTFLNNYDDNLIPDNPQIPPQIPVREPQLPEPFNKLGAQLNEERLRVNDSYVHHF